jgi:hypothetical protein
MEHPAWEAHVALGLCGVLAEASWESTRSPAGCWTGALWKDDVALFIYIAVSEANCGVWGTPG